MHQIMSHAQLPGHASMECLADSAYWMCLQYKLPVTSELALLGSKVSRM